MDPRWAPLAAPSLPCLHVGAMSWEWAPLQKGLVPTECCLPVPCLAAIGNPSPVPPAVTGISGLSSSRAEGKPQTDRYPLALHAAWQGLQLSLGDTSLASKAGKGSFSLPTCCCLSCWAGRLRYCSLTWTGDAAGPASASASACSQPSLAYSRMAKCWMVPVSTIPLDIFLPLPEPSFTTDTPVAGYYGVSLETHLKSLGREIALPIEACVMMLLASGMKEEVRSAPDPLTAFLPTRCTPAKLKMRPFPSSSHPQGLFRLAAGASVLRKLKSSLASGSNALEEFYSDPHAVAGECQQGRMGEHGWAVPAIPQLPSAPLLPLSSQVH